MATQRLFNNQNTLQKINVDAHSFALLLKRISVTGLLAVLLLQGCVHVQQPQAKISITQPDANKTVQLTPVPDSNQKNALQVIGSFAVNTESKGAFLEGLHFAVATNTGSIQNIRIKMKGDNEWLAPAEINIYLDAQQHHQFEIAALIDAQADERQSNTVDFSLSDFRFLKTDATNSINHSVLHYSIVI